jgi:hypothetical protein
MKKLILLLLFSVPAAAQVVVRPTVQPPANLFTAVSATSTQTSNNTVLYPFAQTGTLLPTWTGITGSPSGCTLQVKSGDVIGTFINNGAAVPVTVVNGMTGIFFSPSSMLLSAVQMQVVYACTTYPTAGTLTLDFAAVPAAAIINSSSVRSNLATASLSSASSTAVSFIPAGAAGIFNDISSLVITNTAGIGTIVTLSDNGAGGNTHSYALAANGGISISFNPALPQGTMAAAWDVLNSGAVTLKYEAVFVKNQ